MIRKRNWLHFFSIAVMVGFIGCATVTFPPPVLENNKYTNSEFQYSVDIPPGWEASTEVPKELAFILGPEASKTVKLVLVNKATGGMIDITNERLRRKYANTLKVSRKDLLEYVHELESGMKKALNISRFDYDINQSSLFTTQFKIDSGQSSLHPEEYLVVDVDMEFSIGTTVMVRSKYFAYPCQGGKSCVAVFKFSSHRENFVADRSAYDDFVSSFTVNILKEKPERQR